MAAYICGASVVHVTFTSLQRGHSMWVAEFWIVWAVFQLHRFLHEPWGGGEGGRVDWAAVWGCLGAAAIQAPRTKTLTTHNPSSSSSGMSLSLAMTLDHFAVCMDAITALLIAAAVAVCRRSEQRWNMQSMGIGIMWIHCIIAALMLLLLHCIMPAQLWTALQVWPQALAEV